VILQHRAGDDVPVLTLTRGTDLSGDLQGAGGIGGLLARTDARLSAIGNSGAHAYYHADGNGNITCLINASNAVVARYTYDPYGNLLAMSGPLAEANLYRFSSKESHPNSGTVYYLYRYYEPNLQRWLNRDPLGDQASLASATLPFAAEVWPLDADGVTDDEIQTPWPRASLNLHSFLLNSPLNFLDPLGLEEDEFPPMSKCPSVGDIQRPNKGIGGKGFRGDRNWRNAVKQCERGGDVDLKQCGGTIPTQAEAEAIIQQAKGKVLRVQEGHHPAASTHTYRHINFQTASGCKGAIQIK
jgi:RHS repeat-associated protein